jgi:MerR family transcriptional regulator, thiopeptide resistance regulator
VANVTERAYTVGAAARLAGVSVRALHHYDRLGLLVPGARTPAGYRQYSLEDLRRLRQILFYRELGFGLEEIAEILADPDQDAADHLRRQHRLLRGQIRRRQDMLAAIEKEMEARDMGISLSPEEQFEIFGTDRVSGDWAEEARQRWGDTKEWKQSQRRAAACTKQDWVEIQAGVTAANRELAAAMAAGVPADDPRAMGLAERHRQHISRWFYDCGYDMHRGLARLYLADDRFRENYDRIAPGLAQYIHDAINANADSAGAGSRR